MSSRRYIKRVWQVPKHLGPVTYLAALVTKAMVKHGWPAKSEEYDEETFVILHVDFGEEHPPDFASALEIAVRIAARTYRVDVTQQGPFIFFNRTYAVTNGGAFREVKE